jgi:secreted PhoX family phosphatase
MATIPKIMKLPYFRPDFRLMCVCAGVCAIILLDVAPTHAQPFIPVDTNFSGTQHRVPSSPVQNVILLRSQINTSFNALGQSALVKDNLDFIGYIPINGRSDSGYVIVNTETENTSNVHGDGGGMVVFTAQFKDNTWSVASHPNGSYRTVDFTPVGGTWINCAGSITPWGTVLTGEESDDNTTSNAGIYNNGNKFRDTTDWVVTDFNGQTVNRTFKRHWNMNWVVEVDVVNARALKKHYNMGRAPFEMGYAMPDGRTVYMGVDETPAPFLKFISDTVGNYNKGQLYAYQQSTDGESGIWIPLGER